MEEVRSGARPPLASTESSVPRPAVPEYPTDWPAVGANLLEHDPPHASSLVEWWYLNNHLSTDDGRHLGVFGSFFRVVVDRDGKSGQPIHGHMLAWALSDHSQKRYLSHSYMEDLLREHGLQRLRKGEGVKDALIRRSLEEVLSRGNLPKPDRLFEGKVTVSQKDLRLDFSGSTLTKEPDGSYSLVLLGDKVSADLKLRPRKPPIRHGDNGLVYGVDGGDMFYYLITRNDVSGTVTLDGKALPVSGQGWYDHEFGGQRENRERYRPANRDTAWNWVAIQLQDGREITIYFMEELSTHKVILKVAILVERDGSTKRSREVEEGVDRWWQSVRTFERYPSEGYFRVPELDIDLKASAIFEDQEFVTLMSKPSFWEGEIVVKGTVAGEPVEGVGYFEHSGYSTVETLPQFFDAVGRVVRASVKELLPEHPSEEQAMELFASRKHPHLLEGMDFDRMSKSVFGPVREVARRGGKAWRSYAALASCDAVGGDSRRAARWLGLLEILHTGSLIVDDVEDRSEVRRGAPAAHKIFGESLAINSGCAAYFMGQGLGHEKERKELTDAEMLKVYDLYFEGMRAAHTGQALDIAGFDDLVDEAVRTGDTELLEKHILGIYRLKTGAPAGGLARMGVVAGHGTHEQEEGLGRFFESLGMSFQIVDDVLNLRGFERNLKEKGEDLAEGKVTFPVAMALGQLEYGDRVRFAQTLRTKSRDPQVLGSLVKVLESVHALEDCLTLARSRVDDSWLKVEPLLPDSIAKVMLRAFGWYVNERHY